VLAVAPGPVPGDRGAAVEVRLVGRPSSVDDAQERVAAAAPLAAGATLTGFSLADLLELVGSDHLALAELASALRHQGLDAVAEIPLDRLGDTEHAIEVIRAVVHGGLGAWRATVDRAADRIARLDVIERAAAVQRETSALKAFAPLPRVDDDVAPSTGYDDVRTIAVASAMCPAIPFIQVDWTRYGPKLAQVAITYGANDVDGIAPSDTMALGRRRSPKEDIERQIRAAFAEPVARDGRYGLPA
jgi:aminodeoxyfutalosine synthase